MTRYYDTSNQTEAIQGVHFNLPAVDPIIELPDDNIFFQPIPEGKQLVFDSNNIPIGYEDIPRAPPARRAA